jgi:hypothetical protein
MRSQWTCLADRQLLEQCQVDTYRASGPGGQKRNKTSSAVRLRHLPSGLAVIAEESRSQHENKARALRRLRRQLYLQLREAFPPSDAEGMRVWELARARQWKFGPKAMEFWPAAALCLDALLAYQGRLRETAVALGLSTGQLADFLARDPRLWQQANQLRRRFGQQPLHSQG